MLDLVCFLARCRKPHLGLLATVFIKIIFFYLFHFFFTLGAAKVVAWVTVNLSYDAGRFVRCTQARSQQSKHKFSLNENGNKQTKKIIHMYQYSNIEPSKRKTFSVPTLKKLLICTIVWIFQSESKGKVSGTGSLLARFGLEDT